MKNDPYSVVVNNLPRLSKQELESLREIVDELLRKRTPTGTPMRSAEEYFEATQQARFEGDEQMPLRQQYLANGRMFTLTKNQQRVIEGKAGRLASSDVTVYNVSWDALEQQVVSFSIQCNVAKLRRRGAMTTAYHISNAKAFFREVQLLEEDEAAKPQQAVKTVKRSTSAKKIEEYLKDLL